MFRGGGGLGGGQDGGGGPVEVSIGGVDTESASSQSIHHPKL